jgi:hypothetical protein
VRSGSVAQHGGYVGSTWDQSRYSRVRRRGLDSSRRGKVDGCGSHIGRASVDGLEYFLCDRIRDPALDLSVLEAPSGGGDSLPVPGEERKEKNESHVSIRLFESGHSWITDQKIQPPDELSKVFT